MPQWPFRINSAHPRTQQLVAAWPFLATTHLVDIASGNNDASIAGSDTDPYLGATPSGALVRQLNASSLHSIDAGRNFITSAGTVSMRFVPATTITGNVNQGLFTDQNTFNAATVIMRFADGGGGCRCYVNNGGFSSITTTTTTWTAGVEYQIALTWDGSTVTVYVNGVAEASMSKGSPGASGANCSWGVGWNGFTKCSWDGLIYDCLYWERALQSGEVWSLYDEQSRFQHYWEPSSLVVVPALGPSVPVGSLRVSGFAPTLNIAVSIIGVPAGAVVARGYAPAVSAGVAVATPVGGVDITGAAPAVRLAMVSAVGRGTVAVTGFAPQSGQSVSVAIPKGSVRLTGAIPSVASATVITQPGLGRLRVTGTTPSLRTEMRPSTPAGRLSVIGRAPTVLGPTAFSAGLGRLRVTGYAPVLATDWTVSAGAQTVMLAQIADAQTALAQVVDSTLSVV